MNPSKSTEPMHFVFFHHLSNEILLNCADEIVDIGLVFQSAAHSGSVNNFISVINSLFQ